MPKPTDAELLEIEISNVPDLILRRMVWDAREAFKADPIKNQFAVIAHAILALRKKK